MTKSQKQQEDKSMPLATVEAGRRVKIVGVEAGHGLRSRLAALGLVPGTEVEVIANGGRGPFIVAVKDSRLMLGRGMAQKIVVASPPSRQTLSASGAW
jgi:Fe2+ transport system protein FeoA